MSPLEILIVLSVVVVAYVAFTSVYSLDPDSMLLVYSRFSTYHRVYVSGTFSKRYAEDHAGRMPWHDEPSKVAPGLFGWDITLLLWPIYRVVKFPATSIKLRYRASDLYTKNDVPVLVDSTVRFKPGFDLLRFVDAIDVYGEGYDLSRRLPVSFIVYTDKENGAPATQEYDGCVLAQILLRYTQELLHEAVRRAASQLTFVELVGDYGTQHLEEQVKLRLTEPESIFVDAGILARQTDVLTGKTTVNRGVAARAFDFQIEEVSHTDEAFGAELTAPERGRLRGEGINNTASRAGLTPAQVLQGDVLTKAKELSINNFGGSVLENVQGLIGKGTSKSKP